MTVDLTPVFRAFEKSLPQEVQDGLTMANTRARIRMVTLYAFASHHKMLVAGTGNKVEDFGIPIKAVGTYDKAFWGNQAVSTDNVVASNRIANVGISYAGSGEVADASVTGWLSRFFMSGLWPFCVGSPR